MADIYLKIVADALVKLGGHAHLKDIYHTVRSIRDKSDIVSLDAIIRRTLQ